MVLDSLRQPKPTAADTFFLQAVSEAQGHNVTMAAAARWSASVLSVRRLMKV
jgi:hypothetical protein